MRSINYFFRDALFGFALMAIITFCGIFNTAFAQCDPSTLDLCIIGNNNIIQAAFHAQIAKTSSGYSITGQDFDPSGTDYSVVLSNIPSASYPMPPNVFPIWGAMGGRTQAVFLGTDSKIYALGEEDLLIDQSLTSGPAWRTTSLSLPRGITVCDVNKWQGAAGSGSDNDNNNSNATGEKDGFLVFSTHSGEVYITGDGASAIQSGASVSDWTQINMPEGVTATNFAVGYRTLLILGTNGNLYASGPNTYLGDGSSTNLATLTLLLVQPEVSVFGISQIEAGFNSYFILDADGTIHVLGENSEGGLGIGNAIDTEIWSKVGQGCAGGVLTNVTYISTVSTHDHYVSSSAILVDGTIRSWGSNNKSSITSGLDMTINCPIKPTGNNKNAVAISNGGHISPYVNTNVQICNIGHNRQGAFGDGNDELGDYGEYNCNVIPGRPEICGTKEANLTLEKEVSNMSPSTGEDIVFTITVSNLGPEASTGSFVRDFLSSAFYYNSDDSNGDYDHNTGLWVIGPLEVGGSRSLNITVTAITEGPQNNYAQILVDNEVDINSTPGNDSSDEDDDDFVDLNVILCPMIESDTLLCPGDSLFVANDWIYDAGLYIESIPISAECDSLILINVLYIEESPVPQLDVNCEESTFNLSVDPSTVWSPTWGNGDTNFETVYSEMDVPVNLILEAAPNCMENINIDLPQLPEVSDIPVLKDTTILENSLLEIDIGLDTGEWQILWSPESVVDCDTCMIGQVITNESASVTAILEHNSGCSYETSFFLTIEKAPVNIYVPNVFTPDADTDNREWTFFTTPNVIIEQSFIYDRWGNEVFRSTEENLKWDGTSGGLDCAQGVYVFLIKYKDSDQLSKDVSGQVTLLR